MLTIAEQERLAYASGQPPSPVIQHALEIEDERDDLEHEVSELQERIDNLEEKVDGQLEDDLDEARELLASATLDNHRLRRHLRNLAELLVSEGGKTVAGRKEAAGRIQRFLATGQE